MSGAWTAGERATLSLLWPDPQMTAAKISEQIPGRTRNAVIGQSHRLGFANTKPRLKETPYKGPPSKHPDRSGPGSRIRKAYASKGDDCTLSRYVKVPPAERNLSSTQGLRSGGQRWLPDMLHVVLRTGRSIFFRKGVKPVAQLKNLLVSGHSNAKLGRDVRKGLFKGYWIYALSLEERATCPRSCHHWRTCYGNNMPYAKRVDHTDFSALTRALTRQIDGLFRTGRRKGILLRLHALGDFFSYEYVGFWKQLLRNYPNLAIYGYTARTPDSHIGKAIDSGKEEFGRRFAIRWSDGDGEKDCTVSRKDDRDPLPGSAFQCPEQPRGVFTAAGKPILCATCGLCWSTDKNVAFLEH